MSPLFRDCPSRRTPQIRVALVFLALIPAAAQPGATPIEQGKFTLHKFEQPNRRGDLPNPATATRWAVSVDFKFTDRSTAVPLTDSFRSADFTPQAFEIKGKTSRQSSIDRGTGYAQILKMSGQHPYRGGN